MKIFRILAAAAVVALGFAGGMAPAIAQDKPIVILVFSEQLVARDSFVAQDIRNQVKGIGDSFQAQLAQKQDDLRKAAEDLQRQESVLGPEVRNQKRQELERAAQDLRREFEDKKRELESAVRGAQQKIGQSLLEVLSAIVEQRGVTLLLKRSQVAFAAPELDITKEVIDALNVVLPALKIDVPG